MSGADTIQNPQNTSPDQGSFLNGFVVGLFAGAASYFLFATDKGATVREQLAEEWEQAKGQLTESTGAEAGSLRQAITQVAEWLGIAFTMPASAPETKAKPKKTTTKKGKFKGV